jgi:hypothetical protein
MKGLFVIAALSGLVLLGVASTVPARASLPSSSVGTVRITAKNDPVQILSCNGAFVDAARSEYTVRTFAFNRYDYDLVEYEVHYRFFDVAHHLIYEQTSAYTNDLGKDALDVAPGDQTAAISDFGSVTFIDNINLISSLDCKVVSAKFADSSTWKSAAP